MSFKQAPQKFSAAINEVVVGIGDAAMKLGGESVLPLYSFDGPIENRPKVGFEISDKGYDHTLPELDAFFGGETDVVALAKKAAAHLGTDFLAINLESADPNGDNRSAEDCAALLKAIADAVDKPIVIEGCKNIEKDTAVFGAIADALQGKNVLFMSAREENYKTIAASAVMAYGQKISAESAVDINLAKQLNVLIGQLGVPAEATVMNVGSAAAGYGFEYVASTLDRVRSAALSQDDRMLQMPIITPVAVEAWGVKEAIVSEEDVPEWGSREERGISMEIATAAACLAGGSNAVILRHPASVDTIAGMLGALL